MSDKYLDCNHYWDEPNTKSTYCIKCGLPYLAYERIADLRDKLGIEKASTRLLRDCLHQAEQERDNLQAELKSKELILDNGYAKTERLWKWARERLTGDIANEFWQIVANGSLLHENPDYQQRINMLRHERNELTARAEQAEIREKALREVLKLCLDSQLQYSRNGLQTPLAGAIREALAGDEEDKQQP